MFPSDIDLNDLTAAVSTTDANSSTSAATGATTLGRPHFIVISPLRSGS